MIFYIGLNGRPPQMFVSPHVALLAKTLDTPNIGHTHLKEARTSIMFGCPVSSEW